MPQFCHRLQFAQGGHTLNDQDSTRDLGRQEWLLTQLREFDQFHGSKHSLIPDAESAETALKGLIEPQPFFIAEDSEGPAGFICGHLGPHHFNPGILVLTEVFWGVEPKYRGSSDGARLFRAFDEFGQENADWVLMTLEAKSPVDPRSIERHGYSLAERTFLRETA